MGRRKTRKGSSGKPAMATAPEPIRRGESYTLQQFKERTGLGDWAIREARRSGLTVKYQGRKAYITGDDWLDYLAAQPQPEVAAAV